MTTTQHTLAFTFDRSFFWRALWRDQAWYLLYAVGICVVSLLLLTWALGSTWFLAWIPVCLVLLAVFIFLRLRVAVWRNWELWRKQSPSGTVRFLVDADGMTVVLDHARSRYLWKDLRRLWRYPDVWLLEIVRMQSVLFPPREAPEDMKAFIVDCCRAAGVRT